MKKVITGLSMLAIIILALTLALTLKKPEPIVTQVTKVATPSATLAPTIGASKTAGQSGSTTTTTTTTTKETSQQAQPQSANSTSTTTVINQQPAPTQVPAPTPTPQPTQAPQPTPKPGIIIPLPIINLGGIL